jgi:hypothetical protein
MMLRSFRKYRARRVSDEPKDKAEHFVRCPACGGYFAPLIPTSSQVLGPQSLSPQMSASS